MLMVARCYAAESATTMLVPSGDSPSELVNLSMRTEVTVDAFTVDRLERRVVLDGAGAGALSGQDLDAPTGSNAAIRLTFDQLALVYYRSGGTPVREAFPSLPAVGAAERAMDCNALAVEVRRAETIRWWARVSGATPYTAHEIRKQHAHKAELVAGAIVAWPLLLYGAVGAGVEAVTDPLMKRGEKLPPRPVDASAYRWAITAADRRELELLTLKRDHACDARSTGNDAGTDLAILAGVEDSVRALVEKRVSEDEQMAQQTRWLDQLYPSPPMPAIAPVSDLVAYQVEWRSNVDPEHHPMKALNQMPLEGHMHVREDELLFSGKPIFGKHSDTELRVPYRELADASVIQIHAWQGILITYRDGHQDLLAIFTGGSVDAGLAQMVRDQVKARLTKGP